jgi:hypothetical protein
MAVIDTSAVLCPLCGGMTVHAMPMDRCVIRVRCRHCHGTIVPKVGDCCIFCSYGDTPCPPIQMGKDTEKLNDE